MTTKMEMEMKKRMKLKMMIIPELRKILYYYIMMIM
jgi:hypothetical protein